MSVLGGAELAGQHLELRRCRAVAGDRIAATRLDLAEDDPAELAGRLRIDHLPLGEEIHLITGRRAGHLDLLDAAAGGQGRG